MRIHFRRCASDGDVRYRGEQVARFAGTRAVGAEGERGAQLYGGGHQIAGGEGGLREQDVRAGVCRVERARLGGGVEGEGGLAHLRIDFGELEAQRLVLGPADDGGLRGGDGAAVVYAVAIVQIELEPFDGRAGIGAEPGRVAKGEIGLEVDVLSEQHTRFGGP